MRTPLHVSRYAALALLVPALAACRPREPRATITASPQLYCTIPQDVVVTWKGFGSSVRLRAEPDVLPAGASGEVAPEGSRDVSVPEGAVTFTLTAQIADVERSASATVGRLSGVRPYGLQGIGHCRDNKITAEVNVLSDEFSRDVVVRRVRNGAGLPISLQGAEGAITIPSLTVAELSSPLPLVGTWTLTTPGNCGGAGDPSSPLEGGSEQESATVILGVELEVGCP